MGGVDSVMNDIATPYLLANYAPVPESGCWLWLGGWSNYGYGKVNKHGRVVTEAHRLFYAIHRGTIPDGFEVMHTCDTPACCNPDHLVVGTHFDNMQDMHRKGRARHAQRHGRGEKNG